MNSAVKNTQLLIEPLAFNKVLKLLKANDKLFIKIDKNKVHLRNVDFKQFLGLITVQYPVPNIEDLDSPLFLSLDLSLLISLLDNFKTPVLLVINPTHNYVEIRSNESGSKEKHVYKIPYESSPRIKKVLDLPLIPNEQHEPVMSFKAKANDLAQLLKAVTTIDNNVCFKFLKENRQWGLSLYAKKTNTLFEDTQQGDNVKIFDLCGHAQSDYLEYTVYFNSAAYAPLIKAVPVETIFKVSYYDQYVTFKPLDPVQQKNEQQPGYCYTLYIPLKK